ncbi:DinB family protein [Microlunatus speluncae]|uniref:DinB family protein n=1 Tax=Microlunatus speluncae TaxID=2594267 RepID=UPI0012663872|nr:DinB family protein [Microlunatus speluncae]
MDVDWNAELIDQLEDHWHGQLRPRLDGLSDEEFFWHPAPGAWTLSRRGESAALVSFGEGEFTLDYADPPPDPPPVTTIAWRLGHLIDVFGPPDVPHFDRPRLDHQDTGYPGSATAALTRLDEAHDAWISDLRALGAVGLGRAQEEPPQFANAPMAKLVLHTHREIIHHGAEISLLRDLYRTRPN